MSQPTLRIRRAAGWVLGFCLLGLLSDNADQWSWAQVNRPGAAQGGLSLAGGRPASGTLPQRRPSTLGAAPRSPSNRSSPSPQSNSPVRSGNRGAARLANGPTFPYDVVTIAHRTPVRSAPSDEAYATDYLGPHTSLQVWRHDPNGWLAIRPPSGSFALIEAKNCTATDNPDVFTVAVDRTKAWVGTRIDEDHSPISQVRLKIGEPIAVISSLIIEEESGSQTWYQIEPPSGEFRWVHVDDLRSPGRSLPGSSANTPNRSRPSDLANRPQPPADGPMSGYLPSFGGVTANAGATGPNQDSGNWPALDLGPHQGAGPGTLRGAGHSTTNAEQATWRAAQQETLALASEPSSFSGTGLTPADNPLAHPGLLGAGMPTVAYGSRGDGLAAQPNDGNFVKSIGASPEASPGDLWDLAVNRLRQDPVANAIANQIPQSPLEGSLQAASSAATGVGLGGGDRTGANPSQDAWTAGVTGDWNQRLAAVQSQLAVETARPSQQWNLMPLLERCRELWHSAPSPLQQQAAADVGRRVEELLQLQQSRPQANDLAAQAGGLGGATDPWAGQRFASAGPILPGSIGGPPPTTRGEPSMTAASGTMPNAPSTPPTATPGLAYDAVGYLKELIMARGQKTNEYVLQDETGRSICHLAAQPGVNLNNHLDKKVGVIGIKGIHGKLNLPHVNVERIYPVP